MAFIRLRNLVGTPSCSASYRLSSVSPTTAIGKLLRRPGFDAGFMVETPPAGTSAFDRSLRRLTAARHPRPTARRRSWRMRATGEIDNHVRDLVGRRESL